MGLGAHFVFTLLLLHPTRWAKLKRVARELQELTGQTWTPVQVVDRLIEEKAEDLIAEAGSRP